MKVLFKVRLQLGLKQLQTATMPHSKVFDFKSRPPPRDLILAQTSPQRFNSSPDLPPEI